MCIIYQQFRDIEATARGVGSSDCSALLLWISSGQSKWGKSYKKTRLVDGRYGASFGLLPMVKHGIDEMAGTGNCEAGQCDACGWEVATCDEV
jgi:hypothetical protein